VSVPELAPPPQRVEETNGDLAVMLTGGGARAAYQVGLLRGIARHFPLLRFQIITGVSAGAINAIFLAAKDGTLAEKVEKLTELWRALECHHVFFPNYAQLIPFRTALRSVLPNRLNRKPHGLFNAAPLAELLHGLFDCHLRGAPIDGIRQNLRDGWLKAVALTALDYSTGQSVRWVQGRNTEAFDETHRRSERAELTVEHILASAALPFIFPAVLIGNRWYGDGGIRLSAPLSPAVHLGASRILAMSTGFQGRSGIGVGGYPPPAQILSQLVSAVFLDVIEEDVERMQRMNEMLALAAPEQRNGFRRIGLFVLRPSRDLGKIAADYQRYLPRSIRLFTRALGTDETESPDFISMLMFEPNYTQVLIEIGEQDVESRLDQLRVFLGEDARPRLAQV
jgi:NTE family protein